MAFFEFFFCLFLTLLLLNNFILKLPLGLDLRESLFLLVYLIINLILLDLREKVINELLRFYEITREERMDQFEILKFEKDLLREELIDID